MVGLQTVESCISRKKYFQEASQLWLPNTPTSQYRIDPGLLKQQSVVLPLNHRTNWNFRSLWETFNNTLILNNSPNKLENVWMFKIWKKNLHFFDSASIKRFSLAVVDAVRVTVEANYKKSDNLIFDFEFYKLLEERIIVRFIVPWKKLAPLRSFCVGRFLFSCF